MPYEALTVAYSPVIAHNTHLRAIKDARKHVEPSCKTERISYHHLPGNIHLRYIYGIIAFQCREELFRMADGIFPKTYAPVKAELRNYLKHRLLYRSRMPRNYSYKPFTRDENIIRQEIRNAVRHGIRRRHQGQSTDRIMQRRGVAVLCRGQWSPN